ncbi:methylated-DNA--[protein]-cysteine S-methyltransferase [Desulfofundulus salinus]|uniref:methylated-DNA--[protein]-cysteine S-methyltransferase n=1 Tax=Desulfofundulus salinus TaxID=2419843 RepID=A0A494WTA0_9FIRM|nr:methylated-DNA--[protein]-cysteine S-methyltransferase [Desulfofundulus salinum]RKO65993.1 methylated-DNA--[protein]-cysteine S-methyltransferase [Desulfofundulus salinum]
MNGLHLLSTKAGWVGTAWGKQGLLVLTFPRPSREEALTALQDEPMPVKINETSEPAVKRWPLILEERLNHYFQGRPLSFADIPVDLSWCTPFVARVLDFVRRIGYGELWSYQQVAAAVGNPRAARAVGGALGANRVPLVIPCHRVIRRDGSPGGFSGGLPLKLQLLQLEGVRPGPTGRYQLTNGPTCVNISNAPVSQVRQQKSAGVAQG